MSFDDDPPASLEDDERFDNHSGSRLVLLLLMLPVSACCGWAGLVVGRELFSGLGHDISQRAGYVSGGVTLLAVVLMFLRWQWSLSPRVQQQSDDEIDEMSEDDDFDSDDDL